MDLYGVIDIVSKNLDPKGSDRMAEYLKSCLDDNIGFLRSRFCKRCEGDMPNRDLGDIKYIVFGTSQVYNHGQKLYIEARKIKNVGTVCVQIMWGNRLDYIEEDIALCKCLGFGDYKTIII